MNKWRRMYSMIIENIKDFDSFFVRELQLAHCINEYVDVDITLQESNIKEITKEFNSDDVHITDDVLYYYGYEIPVIQDENVTPHIIMEFDIDSIYKYEVLVDNGKYTVTVYRKE